MSKYRRVYLNKKQEAFLKAPQPHKTFVGGRGTGKSTTMGADTYNKLFNLPRSKGVLLGVTYQQILSRFLPPMVDFWQSLGYRRHVSFEEPGHFVIGQRPPSHWPRPFQTPETFHNVISWANGSAIEMISFDRKDLGRGGNNDYLLGDEAFMINKDRLDKEIIPSLRGNRYRWPESVSNLLHSTSFFSSMPWLMSGMWVPDRQKLADRYPDEYFHLESTAYDNIDVLGQRYIDTLKRELPDLVFQVEVMNLRITRLPNTFYPSFNESVHVINQSWDYEILDSGITVPINRDYTPELPISLSFDFNAAFNSMLIIQTHEHSSYIEERFVGNMYVKFLTVDTLVDQFIEKYKDHKSKTVFVWGDRNGNNKMANSELTIYESIRTRLEKAGWNVELMVEGLDTAHSVKYTWLDRIHREQTASLPRVRIISQNCPELIISINNSPITAEFKKDKTSERNPNLPQERATHLSDCYDNYLTKKYRDQLESEGGDTFEVSFS